MKMKLTAGLLLLLLAAFTLIACVPQQTEAGESDRFSELNDLLDITTDTTTGCKYIVFSKSDGSGGITPLMMPNGKQDCFR